MKVRKSVNLGLRGCIGSIDDSIIRGWAIDSARADEPVVLDVLVDGVRVVDAVTDLARPDLHAAEVTGAPCGFAVDIASVLGDGAEHQVAVRCACTSADLDGSPVKSIEIRRGAMSREQGVELVKLYDGRYPSELESAYLDYYEMTREEFHDVLAKWTNKTLFEINEGLPVPKFAVT